MIVLKELFVCHLGMIKQIMRTEPEQLSNLDSSVAVHVPVCQNFYSQSAEIG